MKKLLTFAALLLLSLASFADGIVFETGTWAEILQKAKSQDKLVFLDAYTSWCGPCKAMARSCFPDPQVAAYFNANFVNATFDMEKGEGLTLAKTYGVNAYPTLLFIDGDGALVHATVGGRGPSDFLQMGKDVIEGRVSGLPKLIERYKNGERDRKFLSEYILTLVGMGMSFEAPLADFMPGMEGDALLSEENWNVFVAVFQKPNSERAQYFKKNIEAFRAKFGRNAADQKAYQFFNNAWGGCIESRDKAGFEATKVELRALKVANADSAILGAEMYYAQYTEDFKTYAKKAKAYVPLIQPDAMFLNEVSWTFFENVDKKKDLNLALQWATKSVELQPEYANTDTKAMVLKKLGRTDEAIATAREAIALAQKSGEDASETQAALDEMLQGKK